MKPNTGPDRVGVYGSPIPVRGSASVTIKLGSGNFDAEVVIVDQLLAEALLGLHFLERTDGKKRVMTLKNGTALGTTNSVVHYSESGPMCPYPSL